MKHRIDPKVDCVFKSILGKEENRNLLIHFLNAVLEPAEGIRIKDVKILNPYNEKEFIGAKLTVVDVKALDEKGKRYQIEIQMALHPAMSSRMLFTWSSIYHSQIREGDDYAKLHPVISVWIVDGNLFPEKDDCHLSFQVYDKTHSTLLTDHLNIHVLQLPKWKQGDKVRSEKDRWIYFFKEGENIDTDSLPKILDTEEMRQAMKVLQNFSKNQKEWLLYQSRLDAILERNTWLRTIDQTKKELVKTRKEIDKTRKEAEKTRKRAERSEKEKLQTEKKLRHLQSLLKEKGIEIKEL
ncbi:MAG: Rpn family recombination-promoting nuclease/putative transposase [Desulfococcaceae bacterium]